MFNMRFKWTVLPVLLLLAACSNNPQPPAPADTSENTTQEKINGRWHMDRAASEELRGLGNTIDNFTLLNKKKFENTEAYQEYGALLENHIKRIDTYCQLGADCKTDLYTRLDSIKAELPVLSKGNLEESKAAILRVRAIWTGVDSAFNYGD